MNNSDPVQLQCAVQAYAWGKIGTNSTVAQLANNDPSFVIENDKPYAELWMGTHPNGPSQVVDKDCSEKQSLLEWIDNHKGCLGNKVTECFGGRLPFLLKVLSVNKSLSIQAHPNKIHAEKLHAERPEVYKDPNHKPEMAIALTVYEGLCGFRPTAEIRDFLTNVPELAAVVGDAGTSFINQSSDENVHLRLKECFTALMIHPKESVQKHLKDLVSRINKIKDMAQDTSSLLGDLVLRLNSQFPGDVGCFCAFFLNHVVLQPGEAMFLGPNLPHAYLSGDCIECMACSDNVVRAGLTPKYRDADTLCEMLDYKPSTVGENIFPSSEDPDDPNVTIYDPPVKDFAVMRIKVPEGTTSFNIKVLDGPSILIVIDGAATVNSLNLSLNRGSVLFLPAHASLCLENIKQSLLAFRAYCDP